MTFDEVLTQVLDLLRRQGRVSYRALKRRFDLDDEYVEDLKAEIIQAQRLAVDEDGAVLVWSGESAAAPAPAQHAAPTPLSYTPRHLAEKILTSRAALEGERKQVTVLFADIKGSMAMLEDLDPEEARRIIDPALQLMMDAVHRYEGYVAQTMGDGILALFGAPIAHEDHPQRALYAALRMQEESARYAEQLRQAHGINVQIRVGVNTGEVVVRAIRKNDLHIDYVPVGHTTGLAARMESLATPGAILVTEPTYRRTEGYFDFHPLGTARVKGVSEPVPLYEVVGVSALRTRFQVAARRGLAPFVGRQPEFGQMQRALALVQEGQGQVVAIVGEPGVGKSRLVYEFKLSAPRQWLVLETFSVSHSKAFPYLPLIEMLKHYFAITPQDDERTRREKVGGKVLMLDRHLEDTLPSFFALLGIVETTTSFLQMDAPMRRRRTYDALKRLLLRESLNQPLLLICEDLHWLDTETQAFLDVLVDSVATARILLLMNYRPEYQHTWSSKTYYTQMRLDPLGRAEAEELLTLLLGAETDVQPLKRRILEQTQGNPFFIEEAVQTLVEQHILVGERGQYRLAQAPTALQIPPTVQGVLAARIDRLAAEDKELLQTLAVIGYTFSLRLIAHVVEHPEETLYRGLSHLQDAEFLYEQPAFPDPEYIFKHALTHDVAYTSLLLERRKALHECTAQAIEALYSDRLEEHYGALAHHYSHSGNTVKAVTYLQLAGQQAAQRSAHVEAVAHLTRGIELLTTLPETLERARQELSLQTTLVTSLMATKGWAAPEVERTGTRARTLCHEVGDTPQLIPALWSVAGVYIVRSELQAAREIGEQLLPLAERTHDPASIMGGLWVSGWPDFLQGAFTSARDHIERGIALYDRQHYHRHAMLFGVDLGVSLLAWLPHSLWHLGYAEQALQRSHIALTLAQELSHPYSLAFALDYTAMLHQFRREAPTARERAEAAIALCTEHGFAYYLAWAMIIRGWALTEQGQIVEGLAQMRQGLADLRATGAEIRLPYYLALLAEACSKAGQIEEGFTLLTEALAQAHRKGESWQEAELYRLQGELLLSLSGEQQADAEAHFHQALDLARRQQAKMLELRAAMSLSRLWQQQGKRHAAQALLAETSAWFTEGFDTANLQEARTLLEAWASC
jgi:class 3 adenylate cyclase/predicted ATPase